MIDTGLHPKTVGIAGAVDGPSWRLAYLERGHAEISRGAQAFRLDAPAALLHSWTPEHRLRISAGAAGALLLIGSTALANAIGHRPESADLRFLVERRALIGLTDREGLREAVAQPFAGILRELAEGGAASRSVIEALLRVLLIQFWREQGSARAGEAAGQSGRRLIVQFNNLVEVHFRDRWSVARYASALGVSADRLNDVCRRVRGRTPRAIIVARTMTEARLLLATSFHSIDQIAGLLGFSSAAHFNRFFKAEEGIPPGRFRRDHAEAAPRRSEPGSGDLFDWP